LAGDSLPVTHPVSVPVERPEAIDELFDVISYGKGSAVLRMVEGYLGADRFRRGVSRYLTSHAYGNATSDDLWNSLEAAADRPVRSLLTAWIARPGVPFLTARLEGGRVRWIQRRFSLDGRHVAERWPIPLGIGTRDGVRHELIEAEQGTLEIPRVGAVHLNPGALGFYRVLYDSPLYDRLFEGFDHLSAIDRWILLVDGSAFLLSGDLLPDAYLRLVDAAGRSPAPLLVHELANQLSSSSPGRHPTPLGALLGERAVFRDAARAALRGHLDRFGLDPVPSEPDDAALLRGRVASTLVPLDPEVAERLSGRFGEFDRAPPDLRWPIAFAYARSGAEREFEGLLAALDRPQSEGSALALERALVWFPDPGLVERALGLALTPKVNRAHLSNVVREAAYNPHGRAVTWAWINGNLRGAEADYKGTGIFANVLEQAMPFAGLGRSAEVRQELARRPFVDAERATQKGLVLLDLYERLLRAFS
ncbi:MAG TPA: ERAP1-like C-terminal domain-containing protein, partial [Thermoplasmata archaeon]|nr:ERAP1-like C-terminal domain-containing protein [Thermoplasmata archaeon]